MHSRRNATNELDRPLQTIVQHIPHIVHQTWKSAELPERIAPLVETWRSLNPGWEWRLWTDADNEALAASVEPRLRECLEACPYVIQKIDIFRWIYLREHGGVYVDADTECIAPLDAVVAGKSLVLGEEPVEHARQVGHERLVTNCFFAAAPGHPFVRAVLDALTPQSLADAVTHVDVLRTTGPAFVTCVLDASDAPDASILPSHALSPGTYESPLMRTLAATVGEDTPERRRCRNDGTFAIHYWQNSWAGTLSGELSDFDPGEIPGFDFYPGFDSRGHDLRQVGRDMHAAAAACLDDLEVWGFNTDGFAKEWVAPRFRWARFQSGDHRQGLFVRKGWSNARSVGQWVRRRLTTRA